LKMPVGLRTALSAEIAKREGQKIRLRSLGEEGKNGGMPGDLYLKVKICGSILKKIREFFKF
jgi:DnaJ-class molecular chaperone